MFCPKCGQPVNERAAFCGNCGAPIQRRSQIPQPQFSYSSLTKYITGADSHKLLMGFCAAALLFMLLPWFRFSFDSIINSANYEIAAQIGSTERIPRIGKLYISVFGLGDSLSSMSKISSWSTKLSYYVGSNMGFAYGDTGLLIFVTIVYKAFTMMWIAGVLALAASIALSVTGHEKSQLLRGALALCVLASVIGVIIAIAASGKIDEMMYNLLGSSFGSMALMGQAKGLFGFTLAPFAAALSAVIALVIDNVNAGSATSVY